MQFSTKQQLLDTLADSISVARCKRFVTAVYCILLAFSGLFLKGGNATCELEFELEENLALFLILVVPNLTP
jgi:hypothetical protein